MLLVKRRIKLKTGQTRTFKAKQGWREVGGKNIYFRSEWEARYARYLQVLKENGHIQDWLHEPQTFWFEEIRRGTRSYLPDFKVIKPDGTHYWVEVKGYLDRKSRTKISRFRKYYPSETLVVVAEEWFNGKKSGNIFR